MSRGVHSPLKGSIVGPSATMRPTVCVYCAASRVGAPAYAEARHPMTAPGRPALVVAFIVAVMTGAGCAEWFLFPGWDLHQGPQSPTWAPATPDASAPRDAAKTPVTPAAGFGRRSD
jgi:hypothetical protein